MRILLVTNTATSALNFRRKLIDKLIASGHDVYVLIPECDCNYAKMLRDLGVFVEYYKISRSSINPILELMMLFSLYCAIRRVKPDVVFSFFPKPVIFGSLAAYFCGVKRNIAMLEGLGYCFTKRPEPDSIKKKIIKLIQIGLYKISLPLSTGVYFLNSDDAAEILDSVKIRSYGVLGGIGVNLNYFSYSNKYPCSIVFTMISRVLIDKGVREFVEAAKIVKSQYNNVRFEFVGGMDDNLGGVNQVEFKKWISDSSVHFLGVSNDIKKVLEGTSVFVLPSYREGVPRSTQEAMAVGRPIITTNVPGCKETVIDGVNGFLVPPWDAQSLAEKMIYFIENESEIERMGKESRFLAESKFDEDVFCDKLIKILLGKD